MKRTTYIFIGILVSVLVILMAGDVFKKIVNSVVFE